MQERSAGDFYYLNLVIRCRVSDDLHDFLTQIAVVCFEHCRATENLILWENFPRISSVAPVPEQSCEEL